MRGEEIISENQVFILTQSSKTKPHIHKQEYFYNGLPYVQEYYQKCPFRILIIIYNQLKLFMMKVLNVLQDVLHQVNPQQINKKFQVLTVQASNSNCSAQQPMHRPKRTPHRYRTHAMIFVLILPIEKIDFRGDYALSTDSRFHPFLGNQTHKPHAYQDTTNTCQSFQPYCLSGIILLLPK